MRVAITGATGNVGTSVLRSLQDEPQVESIVGIARRIPDLNLPKVTWRSADVARDRLDHLFAGAHAVVHLAWLIQPSHDLAEITRVNIEGSRRTFEAAAEAGVSTLVYASSVGTYAAGPKDDRVEESWPATGIPTSFYSRHKAAVEIMLDRFERAHPEIRVVRLRPALIFKKEAAAGVRRLFLGPLFPGSLLRSSLVPFLPQVPGMLFQAVHSYDVGDAYRRALVQEVAGAFNITAEPVLSLADVAELLGARTFEISPKLVRAGAQATWRFHLQPTPKGWVDMGLGAPLMSGRRAVEELGWTPRYTSVEALGDLLAGLREGAGMDTPPLHPRSGGPLRVRELLTGIGRRGSIPTERRSEGGTR